MQPPIRQGDIPGVQLRHERRLEISAAELWVWVSEPERLSRWLADSAEAHPDGAPGCRLCSADVEGSEVMEDLRTIARDEGRLWVARFERHGDGWESATWVTLRIVGDEPCGLVVLQQGFERLDLSRCLTIWEFYRRRWRNAFDRLTAVLAED